MQINAIGSANQMSLQGVGHQRTPGPDPQQLADALGVSANELRQSAQSGQSLADLAKAKGISSDTLLEAVKSGIKAAGAATAREVSDDQLTTMATNMINRAPGKGGPPMGPPPDGATATGSAATGGSLDLSQLQSLIKSLSDGDSDDRSTSLSDLLGKIGRGGSSTYSNASLGLDQLA